jgi:hypothetical protein
MTSTPKLKPLHLAHRSLRRGALRFALTSLGLGVALLSALPAAEAACNPSFQQVNVSGFGEPDNLYSWSMQVFNGYLYVGTLNNVNGPQIWRWDGTNPWQKVFSRPASTGNTGFRSMTVFNGQLYASTVNDTQGAELWRSTDGVTWQAAAMGGLGNVNNTSFRGLTTFKTLLYMGVQNQSGTGGQLWRSKDGKTWKPVSQDGLGDVTNNSLHSLEVFQGLLYVGTANDVAAQIYRSSDGVTFTRVVGPGTTVPAGFGVTRNQNIEHLYAYNKRLYAGTINDTLGFGVYRTPDGNKYQTVFTGGMGNPDNNIAWRFHAFENKLWFGTGNFNPSKGEGGSVLRSADGLTNWETLVGNGGTYYGYGFGKPINWGIRTFADFNSKLYIGTVQCWKTSCASLTQGTEVWEWSGEACPVVAKP